MLVIEIIFFSIFALLMLAAMAIEFRPRSSISTFLIRRFRPPISSLGSLNRRKLIDLYELSLIEKDIRGLESVVLISARAEAPSESALAPAVIDNFREGVAYRFFVSASERQDDGNIERLYNAFNALFKFALETAPTEGRHSRIRTLSFEDLFRVSYLPIDWNNVPYLFYSFVNHIETPMTLAFKGTQRGVGISREYFRVQPTEARAIIELCSSASEEFLPAIGGKPVSIGNVLPDDKVVRLQDEVKKREKTA